MLSVAYGNCAGNPERPRGGFSGVRGLRGVRSVKRYENPVAAPSADRVSVALARPFTLRLAGTEDQSPMTFFTISGISAFMVVRPMEPVIFLIPSHRPGSRMSSRN